MSKAKGYGNRPTGRHNYGNGLLLVITDKGTSTWYARYKINGKNYQEKIGRAGPRLNSEVAARLCADMIEKARAGLAPVRQAAPRVAYSRPTQLGGFLTEWAAQKKDWSPRHHNKTIERWYKHLRPLWLEDVENLNEYRIVSHLETINTGDTGQRMFCWIRAALNNSRYRGLDYGIYLTQIPDSLKVSKAQKNTRPSYGNDIERVGRLFWNIRKGNNARSIKNTGLFILLSGLRIGEIINLREEYVQLDQKMLVIPRSEMKEKDHWRGDYYLPLTDPMIEILEDAIEFATDGYLMPGPYTGRPIRHEGVEKMFQKLTDRQHTPHGSRTSLRTWALEEGYPVIICDALIDHATSKGSGEHYDKTRFIDHRRDILERWSTLITDKKWK